MDTVDSATGLGTRAKAEMGERESHLPFPQHIVHCEDVAWAPGQCLGRGAGRPGQSGSCILAECLRSL